MNQRLELSNSSFLAEKNIHLMRLIGVGSFSKVYMSRVGEIMDNNMEIVATKVINKKRVSEKFVTKYLPRELDVLIKLQHPFVIMMHSVYQHSNVVYINMEYAGNGDMATFLNTVRLTESQIRQWLVQILWAFKYMHRCGVVHRDLKCENILLTDHYNVRIADFGFARFVARGRHPRVSSICGTQAYSAPELLSGVKPYNPVITDVWAIGVVLFVMANNLPPFNQRRKEDMFRKQLARDYKFRSTLGRHESLKTLTAAFLEPNTLLRITIKNALKSSWVRAGNIQTPEDVQRALESTKTRESLRQPVISSNTLIVPIFSLETEHTRTNSELNENFTDIHKPDEDFRPLT